MLRVGLAEVPRSLWAFVSSVPADHPSASLARAEPSAFRRHTAQVDEENAGLELGFRYAVVQVGYWLGWAAILVVLSDLTLDVGARHRWLLVGATLCAAAGNTIAMVIPWREWLTTRTRPSAARSLVRRVDRVRGAARRRRRRELRLAALSHRTVHRRRTDRVAARLLARRQRGDVHGRCSADPTLGRRDRDATLARGGRRRGGAPRSRERSAAKRPHTDQPPAAPSSNARSRKRRTTGSRTTCRRPPTSCCSDVPTAHAERHSTRRPRGSARSPPCTAC